MSKRITDKEKGPYAPPAGGSSGNSPILLVGIALLLVLGGWSLAEVRSIRKDLGEKITQLDTKVVALQAKVGSASAAQARRSGPDPDKAYTIRTEGSPMEGVASAVVTIAEFSDFQ